MLYPDLRRLALVCPTGMPLPRGTNNHEAGGSNDPLPPPPSRTRPGEGDEAPATAQEEALGKPDILYSILLALADGDFADVCRAAARWCFLNKAHMAACEDGVWEELTGLVFPNARAPNTGRADRTDEPTNPKDWFFHLCTQHKRLRDLREERWELSKKRVSTKDAASRAYVNAAAKFAQLNFKRKLLDHILRSDNMPPHLPDVIRRALMVNIGRLQNQMNDETRTMAQARREGARPTRQTVRAEDDERLLRAISLQKTYLRDIFTDPEEQGPPTVNDYIRRRRRLLVQVDQDRALALQAEQEEAERKRQERHDLAEQYRAWLAALEQMNPREAALSRLVAEARELIKSRMAEVRPNVMNQMWATIMRIDRERRARHTFTSHPNLMSRLEGELARDVRYLNMMSDESVSVYDLFGSEGEDE